MDYCWFCMASPQMECPVRHIQWPSGHSPRCRIHFKYGINERSLPRSQVPVCSNLPREGELVVPARVVSQLFLTRVRGVVRSKHLVKRSRIGGTMYYSVLIKPGVRTRIFFYWLDDIVLIQFISRHAVLDVMFRVGTVCLPTLYRPEDAGSALYRVPGVHTARSPPRLVTRTTFRVSPGVEVKN